MSYVNHASLGVKSITILIAAVLAFNILILKAASMLAAPPPSRIQHIQSPCDKAASMLAPSPTPTYTHATCIKHNRNMQMQHSDHRSIINSHRLSCSSSCTTRWGSGCAHTLPPAGRPLCLSSTLLFARARPRRHGCCAATKKLSSQN